jgi:hypothetical protein
MAKRWTSPAVGWSSNASHWETQVGRPFGNSMVALQLGMALFGCREGACGCWVRNRRQGQSLAHLASLVWLQQMAPPGIPSRLRPLMLHWLQGKAEVLAELWLHRSGGSCGGSATADDFARVGGGAGVRARQATRECRPMPAACSWCPPPTTTRYLTFAAHEVPERLVLISILLWRQVRVQPLHAQDLHRGLESVEPPIIPKHAPVNRAPEQVLRRAVQVCLREKGKCTTTTITTACIHALQQCLHLAL